MQGTVVHIIWHLDIGGGELFLRDLVRELSAAGVRQHVFCVGPTGRIAPEIARLGIPITVLGKRTRLGAGVVIRLALALRRMRPAVIQTHGEPGVFWGLPAAWWSRAPIVSLLYHDQSASPLHAWISRLLLRMPDRVIAGSASVARFLTEERMVSAERLGTILCGVVIDPPMDDERRLSGGPRLVSVGRLVDRKGHRTLIEALPAVLKRYPDAQLQIVGDGPLRDDLERTAHRLDVAAHVDFSGSLYPAREAIKDSDLFVFPSLTEPQGLAVLDAFAAGVPVVASRAGGIVEMIDDGVEGVLVRPGDSDGLASAILQMLDNEELRRSCVAAARARLGQFDIKRIAHTYLETYKAVRRTPAAEAAGPGRLETLS